MDGGTFNSITDPGGGGGHNGLSAPVLFPVGGDLTALLLVVVTGAETIEAALVDLAVDAAPLILPTCRVSFSPSLSGSICLYRTGSFVSATGVYLKDGQ